MKIHKMGFAVQQGKLTQGEFGKGREMGSSAFSLPFWTTTKTAEKIFVQKIRLQLC